MLERSQQQNCHYYCDDNVATLVYDWPEVMHMPGINQAVGERIRALMEQKGLTLKEVARQVRFHEMNLNHILRGRADLKPEMALRLSEFLGVSLEEIYAKAPLPVLVPIYLRLRPGEDREEAIREVEEAVRNLRQRTRKDLP
jgi:transcriptional regulator with XRE-family HTH domain